ncbi:MAG: hypothetical protein AAF417_10155 [Pseudomonadota bacterium]
MARAPAYWRRALSLVVAGLVTVAAPEANGEPYLAVFKGMQCASCHSHPAGGGKRNLYGNVFSQAELPAERLGAEGELWTGDVLKWLSVGANLRAGYQNVDTPNQEQASTFDITRGTVYLEASVIPNRLSIYLDQQVAPNASLNREAYVRLRTKSGKLNVFAGQFYLPYGLRLQDDTAFVRQFTGVNFANPDRGVQVSLDSGPWSTQLSLTNGSGGGTDTDTGKQLSWVGVYVRPNWRLGASLNINDADVGDRRMQNLFAGLKTGPIAWLFEVDLIVDDLAGGLERDAIVALAEGNLRIGSGQNLKLSYDYFDPDTDLDEDHQVRWSLVWEFTPFQFLQTRLGARVYDGIPQDDRQNRDVYFAELHGFF